MATRSDNRRIGVQIEEYRADQRGPSADHVGTDGWFDVDDDGTPVEVKSAERNVAVTYGANDRTRPGRYQLEESNHRNLTDHNGEYDFVLRNDRGEPVAEATMTAGEVNELLDENNREWPDGSKLKISHKQIHGEVPSDA